MDRILFVEDMRDMQLIVESALNGLCEVVSVDSLAKAEKTLSESRFSLMLLDVSLPDGNGFEFCRKLKAEPRYRDLPIIFLTGESDINQKVLGFELGAEDYVTKPLEPQEFTARVIARLKREKKNARVVEASGVRLDVETQRAWIKNANQAEEALNLTPIEFKLLAFLMRKRGEIATREELISGAWGGEIHVSSHTLDTHLSSLRKKLGNYASSLKSVPRKGYIFQS